MTINRKPETQNQRSEPTGLAEPSKTHKLTGTGPGLAHQDPAGRVFGRFWNRTKLFFRSKPGPLVGYPDPLLTLKIPENSGNLDPVSKFVQVGKAPAAIALQVVSVGNIVGCAHVIPEIATSSKTGDGRNERWIVNSYIDLATWNDVYN